MKLKKILPFLFVTLLTFSPMSVHAETIDAVKTELISLNTSLESINSKLADKNDQINEKTKDLTVIESQLNTLKEKENSLNDSILTRENQFQELNNDTDYKLLLSKSKSSHHTLNKMSDLKNLIKEDQVSLIQTNTKIEDTEDEQSIVKTELHTLKSEKEDIEKEKNDIESKITEKQSIIAEYNRQQEEEKKKTQTSNPNWNGSILTKSAGVNCGPSGKETYYNLNMSGVVNIMRNMGNNDEYWIRNDGCKILGNYIMVAANLNVHPRGSLVETSLGTGIVCDTGGFASENATQLDIATTW